MGLAASTALVTLLTPTAIIPAATRAVAVGALSDLLSRPLSIWKRICCYRGIRKALLYLFSSSGYGNDNNYVKVNTKSKMTYTLRTGWSFSVCLIPNAGSHSFKRAGVVGGEWPNGHSPQYHRIPQGGLLNPTFSSIQQHSKFQPHPPASSTAFPISLQHFGHKFWGCFLSAHQTPHQQLHTTLTTPPLHSGLCYHMPLLSHIFFTTKLFFSASAVKPALFKLPSLTSYLKKRHLNSIWNIT